MMIEEIKAAAFKAEIEKAQQKMHESGVQACGQAVQPVTGT